MRPIGALLIALLVGIVAIGLLVKLVFFALKLVGVLIGVGLAIAAYFAVERMIGKSRHA